MVPRFTGTGSFHVISETLSLAAKTLGSAVMVSQRSAAAKPSLLLPKSTDTVEISFTLGSALEWLDWANEMLPLPVTWLNCNIGP